jgi:(R)-2-hydroxyacyl-CoA dehydratese activating ATPase
LKEGGCHIEVGNGLLCQRTVAMLRRVGMEAPLVFAGGVAHNPCVRKVLEEQLEREVIVP